MSELRVSPLQFPHFEHRLLEKCAGIRLYAVSTSRQWPQTTHSSAPAQFQWNYDHTLKKKKKVDILLQQELLLPPRLLWDTPPRPHSRISAVKEEKKSSHRFGNNQGVFNRRRAPREDALSSLTLGDSSVCEHQEKQDPRRGAHPHQAASPASYSTSLSTFAHDKRRVKRINTKKKTPWSTAGELRNPPFPSTTRVCWSIKRV